MEADALQAGGRASHDLAVVPRDGLRARFDAVVPDPRVPWRQAVALRLELDRDGFARGEVIEDRPGSSW